MDANLITPPHAVRDGNKLAAIVADMAANGWTGRPILIVDAGTWIALTGSHRLAAAAQLGIDVPIVEANADEWEGYTAAHDDEDRIAFATSIGDEAAIELLTAEVASR